MKKQQNTNKLSVQTNGGNISFDFKQELNPLALSAILKHKQSDDIFSMYELLFNSTCLSKDVEPNIQILFYPQLKDLYLTPTSFETDVVNGTLVLKSNDGEWVFNFPTRDQFKEIFNRNLTDFNYTIEYIFTNCLVSGKKGLSTPELLGMEMLPKLLMYEKSIQLKKK